MALPICTAPPETDSLSLVSSAELNVAVNAVATGAAADSHYVIAGLGMLLDFIDRQQADVAAIDERIAQVARIEITAPFTVGMPIRLP